MKHRPVFRLFFLAAVFLAAAQCRTPSSSVTRENFATHYKTEATVVRPSYVLYNLTDSVTRLYFSISSADLLYTKKDPSDNNFSARVILNYIVHPVDYAKAIIDSGHVVFKDAGIPGEDRPFTGSVDIDIAGSGKFYVEISFRDVNKMTLSHELLYLDHRGKEARNNFVAMRPSGNTPLFRNYTTSDEAFTVQYNRPDVTRLFVRYFSAPPGIAPPPYAQERRTSTLIPDSTWWIPHAAGATLSLPRDGWYTFTTDSAIADGFTMARFHDGFPKITVIRQLLYPLRYLTTREEYAAMDTAVNTKHAVDAFWLQKTGSQERAREVIRYFYNRVEAANKLFGNYREGWKTDRGMIYLVFGPPPNVYRNVHSETWIYSNDTGPGNLVFVFNRKENAFTDQEFVLERNDVYRESWIRAVDSWRMGHVYTLR